MKDFLKKHKFDILLVLAVLVIAGGFWIFRAVTRETGGAVEVTSDGAVVATLPLDRDTVLTIGEGEHTNTLVIREGAAHISHASCPDHICMDRGEVRYDGETIVCLPNDLLIRVTGGRTGELDGVSQ